MELICLGSSSRGNGYVITNGRDSLLLEAGMSFREVKRALDYKIETIAACLVSHRHLDHAGHINDVAKAGIPIISPEGGYCKCEVNHAYKIGNWMFMPIQLYHDVPCWGYLVQHPETGTFLFATDTCMIQNKFAGLNHILIEANYSDDCINQSLMQGLVNYKQEMRIRKSHLSLKNVLRFLYDNDLSKVNNIVLLHLSANNSDAIDFIEAVHRETGKRVTIADNGVRIPFNKIPF